MRLQGKIALITGAGTGIGKTTALRFANEGAKVVVTDINLENVKKTAAEIQQSGGEAIALHHDVSNEDSWKQVVDASLSSYGQIDILFNNAGIYFIKPLAETTLDEFNRMMSINVTSVFLGMKHVMPLMAKKGSGSVINASSVAGLKGAAGHIAYGASKGAVRIMTKDAAVEYAPANVRVNSIHPAYINTAMGAYAVDKAKLPESELAQIMAPLGRFGTVEEVANLVVFLASDESSFSTGAEFILDGGATAK
ncbi:SDR family NAD(P)-dependent oxidoreductase [Bacillus sp. FJAT-28004]|uniref:SDR family NAD(P)-dependent oxidoreductase n=1 Tax=Bacillus sp. FJAT-28004 TaxID=1679165 RepID=UPI0006B52124|nr:glucose 1-dehydrogenase [Bacillus sp. FJAT-28004]